jgi:hypothetical protein
MSAVTDPLQILADLEPAMLSQLADDAYDRNRQWDIARATASDSRGRRLSRPGRPAGPASSPRLSRPPRLTPRWRLAAGVALATAAAVGAVAVVAAPHGTSGRGPAVANQQALSARTFLLTSADIATRQTAATGAYWYVRERDYEPTAPRSKDTSFGAMFAATEESWTGTSRTRTIVSENLTFSFATAADKARWQAAGSPKLAGPGGFGNTGPAVSNYKMSFHWGLGRSQLSFSVMSKLPTTAAALGKLLNRMWRSEPDKAAAVGLPHPDFGQYLLAWADIVLTGPTQPGTKAAIYQLLAGQPGVTIAAKVTDPLGRTGDAIGNVASGYLLIDPATAQLLAFTPDPVHAGTALRPAGGLGVYVAMGWTNHFGVAQP